MATSVSFKIASDVNMDISFDKPKFVNGQIIFDKKNHKIYLDYIMDGEKVRTCFTGDDQDDPRIVTSFIYDGIVDNDPRTTDVLHLIDSPTVVYTPQEYHVVAWHELEFVYRKDVDDNLNWFMIGDESVNHPDWIPDPQPLACFKYDSYKFIVQVKSGETIPVEIVDNYAVGIGKNALANVLTNTTSFSSTSIKTLQRSALSGNGNLVTIKLPNATSIGGFTFDGCSSLTSLELQGFTMEEVSSQRSSWKIPNNCTIVCKDGTLQPINE